VSGTWVCWRFAGQTDQGSNKIGATYDPDEPSAPQHRQAFDAVNFHELHHLSDQRRLRDGNDVPRHDILHLAAVRAHVVARKAAPSEKDCEPARTLMLGADLRAPEQIPFGNDADELARTIDDRKAAHAVLQHEADRLLDRGIRRDGYDTARHHITGFHAAPLLGIQHALYFFLAALHTTLHSWSADAGAHGPAKSSVEGASEGAAELRFRPSPPRFAVLYSITRSVLATQKYGQELVQLIHVKVVLASGAIELPA
jgi:hypothetical protein